MFGKHHRRRNPAPAASDTAVLFSRYDRKLRDRVSAVVNTSQANIEDACMFAWLQLLRHEIDEIDAAYSWLTTVAIREAVKLDRADRRTRSKEWRAYVQATRDLAAADARLEAFKKTKDYAALVRLDEAKTQLAHVLAERSRKQAELAAAKANEALAREWAAQAEERYRQAMIRAQEAARKARFWTRLLSIPAAIGHSVEAVVACPLAETGIGAVGCIHGFTSVYSDLDTLVNDNQQPNLFHQAGAGVAKLAGLSDETGNAVGTAVDIGGSFAALSMPAYHPSATLGTGPAPQPPASRPVAGFGRPVEPAGTAPPAASRPVAGFGRPVEPLDTARPAMSPPAPATTKPPLTAGPVRPAPASVESLGTEGPAGGAGEPTRMRGDEPTRTGSKPAAPKSSTVGKVETATDAASRISKITEWVKKNKISGDVEQLKSRLRSSDPQTRADAEAEFDEASAAIAKGERHHIEEFETPARPSKRPEPSRISTTEKSELENSSWLKKRLPQAADRKKFMDWLKAGHKEGDLGAELKAGHRDLGKHEHLSPGSSEAESKVREWESEQGRTPPR